MAWAFNFTGENKSSSQETAFFPTISTLVKDKKSGGRNIFSYGTDQINTPILAKAFTSTDGNYSIFNLPNENSILLGQKLAGDTDAVWNFSSQSESLFIENFKFPGGYRGLGRDTFNLGAGSDVATIYFRPDEDPLFDYSSYFLDSERVAGYMVRLGGGPGNDRISLLNSPVYVGATLVSVVEGNAGNDIISSEGFALICYGDSSGKAGDKGVDRIEYDILSDYINGGPGNDVIVGSHIGYHAVNHLVASTQKDFLVGGLGKDTFVLKNAYGVDGINDFVYIGDFEAVDKASCGYFQGDLLIDPTPGTLALQKTETYAAQTVNYKARIYLDSDGSSKIEPLVDELLAYVNGVVPKQTNFIFGDLS